MASPSMHTRIISGGAWKKVLHLHTRVSGSWKEVLNGYTRVGGVWKQFHEALLVSPVGGGATRVRINASCFAGIEFRADGDEFQCNNLGVFNQDKGPWLDNGAASKVWVQMTINGGSPGTWNSLNPGTGRLQLSTTRSYRCVRSTAGFHTVSATFVMWDAASGGNQLATTGSSTYSAQFEFDPCPLCCFTPDTMITMAAGHLIPIIEVRKGDDILVLKDGKNVPETVTGIITRENRNIYRLHFADGAHIDASDDHPFDVKGVPASIDHHDTEYKDLGFPIELKVGDHVTDQNFDDVKIIGIELIEYPGTVYTLENSRFYAHGLLVY